ncbi:MAG: hypothetical protein AAF467_27430 [Actinomycetota bacterium]
MDLIGRDDELAALITRLRERRLITIVGPGGIGKTTLARRAAAEVASTFAGGTTTVDLTTIDDGAGVAATVASQLGFANAASMMAAPLDQARLVLVDNCEHVLDAAATAIAELVEFHDVTTVLATSRAPLDLADEVVVPLAPLPLPLSGAEPGGATARSALDLFMARAADHGVIVDAADPIAFEICERLDGVPLAIELAAARLRTRSLPELLAELDHQPHALSRPRFRGKAAHRSVTDLVGWSTDLLAAPDRDVFHGLGVFAGSFTATMAASVVSPTLDPGEVVDRLDELVAVSLVAADTSGANTWYRLLHPIRAVARHELASAGTLADHQRRWVDHTVQLAVKILVDAGTTWDGDLLGGVMDLYDNLTSALRWCLTDGTDADATRGMLLSAVLWGVVHEGPVEEVRDLVEQAIVRWPERDGPHWVDAAATAATCRCQLGELHAAIDLASEALEHIGPSPYAESVLHRVLARSNWALGDLAGASEHFEAGAAAAVATGQYPFALEQRADHAAMVAALGNIAEAHEIIDEVVAESIERQAPINELWALVCRGRVLAHREPAAAVPVLIDVLDRSRTIRYPAGAWSALRGLAVISLDQGDNAAAARWTGELIAEIADHGAFTELRQALDVAAVVARRAGHPAAADLTATAKARAGGAISFPVDLGFVDAEPHGQVLDPQQAFRVVRSAMAAQTADAAALQGGDAGRQGQALGSPPPPAEARLEGEMWHFRFEGGAVSLKASKGLADLATLLSQPGVEFAAVDLIGASVVGGGSAQAVIDPTARRQYEERIRDLQEALDEADASNDIGRSHQISAALDELVDHLTAATDRGGRARTVSREVERARSTVTQRLRSALRRINDHDPVLGAHLDASIRTGTYCVYRPPTPVAWTVRGLDRPSG